MKSLVVFYSLEGDTKLIAGMIAEKLNSELLELKPEKEIPKQGFQKFLWGGKSVMFNEKPSLANEIPSLDGYDVIFIGTPIWASSYAPPVNTFISQSSISNKKVAFFACHAGGGAQKCFDKLSTKLAGNTVIGKVDFVEPIKQDREKLNNQVKDWLKKIV